MATATDIIEKTLAQFPLPADVFPQDKTLWLTLYLFGDMDSYSAAKPKLEADGWKNLCNNQDYSGFCYPKKAVWNDTGHVRDVLKSVLTVCNDTGLGIIAIDADSALDPSTSRFKTLYQ